MQKTTGQIVRVAIEADPDITTDQAQAALALLAGKPTPEAAEPLLLTVRSTCTALGVSRQSLWRLARENALRPIKVRGATRYRRTDIDAFIRGMGED